jgi:capsular polysaccharide transport system permease protein
MTTNPKATRYNIRRVERPALPPEPEPDAGLFDNHDDGFGNLDFRQPEKVPPTSPEEGAATGDSSSARPDQGAQPTPSDPIAEANAAIAAERLTARQLRRAKLIAETHGIEAASEVDAIRLLREAGIDPFSKASVLRVVKDAPDLARDPDPAAVPGPKASATASAPPASAGRELARLPGDRATVPQRSKPISPPSVGQRAEVNQAAEILRMQRDIARRRRRRLALLGARLFAFVLLPTFLAGWYYYVVATPMYATHTEFQIQQAGPTSSGGALQGLFSGTALATSQDSIAVQGYLQSREAMGRLEEDIGFRSHFQGPNIDPLQRLEPDASLEATYKVYKNYVKISFDQTEGIIRMDVVAADPKVSAEWAEKLVTYAEGQVDQLTQRLRADQMKDAEAGYEKAQTELALSQRRLIELQEKFKILSSESEVALITSQIGSLESMLTQERLALAQMESNESPNAARLEPTKRRVATLEAEVAALRAKLTEGEAGALSLAEVQAELLVAQADLQTRQMILATSLQAMETSRVEANRQVRFLSLSVRPILPDEPAYPRAFENTLVTMLIMLGIYLMVSMTAAILREQVSS